MEMDDTSAVELEPSYPPGRCALCGGFFSSEIEAGGDVEPMSICGACKASFRERMYENSSPMDDDVLDAIFMEGDVFYGGDSDASVDSFLNNDVSADVDSQSFVDGDTYINPMNVAGLNQWNSGYDDDEFEEVEGDENAGTLVGRIQLHRSLATNGRNLPVDWLNEIISSDIAIITGDRRRVHVPNVFEETSRYVGNDGDDSDTRAFEELLERLAETQRSRHVVPPAAVSFVKNLELVVVDDKDFDEGLECVICKDVASVGTVMNRLPCRHIYHPSCIVQWLNARNTCPLCRYEVPPDDKEFERIQSRSHETQLQESEDDEDASSEVVEGGNDESGRGGRWWFVAAPIMSMVGIGIVLWFGGGVFGGYWASQRVNRSSRSWWCLL